MAPSNATTTAAALPASDDSSNIVLADTSAKRKREDDHVTDDQSAPAFQQIQQIQRDLLHVLEQHDTAPSLLNHVLSNNGENFAGPTPKKVKLSGISTDALSIATKLRDALYPSLPPIGVEIGQASEEVVASIRANAKAREGNSQGRLAVGELKAIHRIQALETRIKDIVDKEGDRQAMRQPEHLSLKQEEDGLANGHAPDAKARGTAKSGTVLTLFGNAPTPKQLFSSMQNPATSSQVVKSELPVEEMSLPNGITATKVVSSSVEDTKKGPTFDEAFAPPYSLARLDPPKAHKRSSTRGDTSVTWEIKDPTPRTKKGSYTVQPLTTGSWLSYGGVDKESPSTAAREKRKLRNRALSTGESAPQDTSQVDSEEAQAKEEEALFARAYTSFAPSSDNASSVVPTEILNMVWWQKVGDRRFNETFAIDPALYDESSNVRSDHPVPEPEAISEHADFGNILQGLEDLDQVVEDEPAAKSRTDVGQVLQDVSQLLITLASYQRIRNATLPPPAAASRTPIVPGTALSSKVGTPDLPSEDEVATYERLRRELAYLVLKLPPYAVAKLDGDQLAGLGVSKLITFESKDTQGIMEEDQVSRSAKLAAMATANSIASLTRPGSSAGQHYNTTAQRTPAIGQAANTRYGQQYGSRTPAMPPQFQRSVSNQQPLGTPNTSARQQAWPQPNSFTRPGAPQPSYGQTNGQQFYRPSQQTPGGYGGYGQGYQQAPQSQPRPSYPPQPSSQNMRPANSAPSYQTTPSAPPGNPYIRTASPAKPGPAYPGAPSQAMPQAGAQQRPGFPIPPPSSGRLTPSNYSSQSTTPVNGYRPPPPPVAPRPASTTPQPPQSQAQASPSSGAQTNGRV